MAELYEKCLRVGLRMTLPRKIILEVFLSMSEHVSLEELFLAVQKKKKGIGQATIYRTMKLFTDAEIAHERRFEDGLTRYELHQEGEHHDHLICVKCNHIIEFEDEIIELRQNIVAQQNGMSILSHKLEIYGECLDFEACQRWQNLKR